MKMFEALLDSAASAAESEASSPRSPRGKMSRSASSESSRTAAATGKAYQALKELVRAAHPKRRCHCVVYPTDTRPRQL